MILKVSAVLLVRILVECIQHLNDLLVLILRRVLVCLGEAIREIQSLLLLIWSSGRRVLLHQIFHITNVKLLILILCFQLLQLWIRQNLLVFVC